MRSSAASRFTPRPNSSIKAVESLSLALGDLLFVASGPVKQQRLASIPILRFAIRLRAGFVWGTSVEVFSSR